MDAEIPRIYDFNTDASRPVTQADIDALVQIRRAYSDLLQVTYKGHDQLKDALRTLNHE